VLSQAQQERLARNEAFFRQVNENIRSVGAGLNGSSSDVYEFFCECPDPDCLERIGLTLAEYEIVRSESRHFIIAPGHDVPEIEHVVSQRAGSAVVEKDGAAGKVADSLDSRD
jgi:hypothetical protein